MNFAHDGQTAAGPDPANRPRKRLAPHAVLERHKMKMTTKQLARLARRMGISFLTLLAILAKTSGGKI
jgi:hypothetical protein